MEIYVRVVYWDKGNIEYANTWIKPERKMSMVYWNIAQALNIKTYNIPFWSQVYE